MATKKTAVKKIEIDTLSKKLSAAKAKLTVESPFIASILLGAKVTEDPNCNTLATDGRDIIYSSSFVEGLTVRELQFGLAHECMHIALMHCLPDRMKDRDHEVWNAAGDYIINDMLIKDRIGDFIKGGLKNEDLIKEGKETTEGVYNILIKQSKQKQNKKKNKQGTGDGGVPQPGASGGAGDSKTKNKQYPTKGIDALKPMSGGSPEELEREAKVRVANAAQSARMAGMMSDSIKRLVNEILKPKVDWRGLLNNFMIKCKEESRSWARPNRRYISQHIFCPAPDGDAMGDIAVAVDCSGSIDNKQLAMFSAEITSIVEDVRPRTTHIIYFDSEISHHDEFPRGENVDIQPHGGGGTAFSPIFKYLDKHDIEPECCVVLTDLCCCDFGDEPAYPVMWVSTMEGKAPWGQVVLMED